MRRLTEVQVQQAAAILLDQRHNGRSLDDLPDDLIPEQTGDIQRIIDATNAAIDRPVLGFKIYAVYKPMNPPLLAPIYDLLHDGATIPTSLSPLRLIEPEIMFRADHDLPARARHYDITEIREAVTAHVGFEVIGSRFKQPSIEHIYALSKGQRSHYGSLSDNIANGCVILGDAIRHWRDVDFSAVAVSMTEDAREIVRFVGGHPFDDPFLPIVVGVNRLRHGPGIRAGDVLITSSSTSFFPVGGGSLIRAAYDGLGAVSARFNLAR